MRAFERLLCEGFAALALPFLSTGCFSQRTVLREYYEPTPETVFVREDGMKVGAIRSEALKSGSPDWSTKDISLITIK